MLCSGCQQDTLVQRLTEIRTYIDDSSSVADSVMRMLCDIRTEVTSRDEPHVDSLYNHVAMTVLARESISESAGVETSMIRHFSGMLGSYATLYDEYDATSVNYQRYIGQHDRSRSSRVWESTIGDLSEASAPDKLANLALEMFRIDLNQHALYSAARSLKAFRAANHLRGQLFAARILCSSTLRIGDTLGAIRVLRIIRSICDSLDRKPSAPDYLVTKLALLHTLKAFPNYHRLASVAFPTTLGTLEIRYREFANSKFPPWEVGTLEQRGRRAANLPLPVLRSHSASFGYDSWISEYRLSSDGLLTARSPIGAYVRMADRWFLTPSTPPIKFSENIRSSVKKADTMRAFSGDVERILPISENSFVTITSDSLYIRDRRGYWVHISIPPLLRSFKQVNAMLHGQDKILILADSNLHVLSAANLQVQHVTVLPVSTRLESITQKFIPWVDETPTLFAIDKETILLLTNRGHYTYSIVHREVKPVSIDFGDTSTFSNSKNAYIYTRSGIQAISVHHNSSSRIVTFCSSGIKQRWRSYPRSEGVQLPTKGCFSPGLLGLRFIDYLDVIDTARRRVYHSEAVPYPVIPPYGPHDVWTVVRGPGDHLDCLIPYGNVILRYPIRSYVSFDSIVPYVIDERTRRHLPRNIDTAERLIHLRYGERFFVGFHQPFVSSFSVPEIRGVKAVYPRYSTPMNGGEYMQLLGSDEIDGAVITHPFTKQQWRINVSRPFFEIPIVQTFAYALSSISVVSLIFIAYRARKRRLAALSESIRHEQLALLREDMHDMIGSRLVRIASLARQGSAKRGEDVLDRIHEMTTTTIRSLRNMLSLMSEEGITDADFFGMMREYVVGACADVNIKCFVTIDVPTDTSRLTNVDRHELLMIITEMVTNSMRHSECTSTRLTVRRHTDHWSIRWSDDGRGIDPRHRRGHGLNNIERRSTRIGASVTITSVLPSGTEFHIVIPIKV